MEVRHSKEGSKFVIMVYGVPFVTTISQLQLQRWFVDPWDTVDLQLQRKTATLVQEKDQFGWMK